MTIDTAAAPLQQGGQVAEKTTTAVTVVNEENGREIVLHTKTEMPMHELIAGMYEKLAVTRQSDDRLRCEGSGQNVFLSEQLTFGAYTAAGGCKGLVWLFAGGTGGAEWA